MGLWNLTGQYHQFLKCISARIRGESDRALAISLAFATAFILNAGLKTHCLMAMRIMIIDLVTKLRS